MLIAAWKNVKEELNRNGVALALTLARYFKRWSLWSKDIIFLVTPDSTAGPQAWVDAYHDAHDSRRVGSLPLKSGALQGAVAIDYVQDNRFQSVHITYDGVNGQLPNLDLINSIVNIAGGQMGMGTALQEMWSHDDKYPDRLRTMLRGMLKQGIGAASGAHSCFIPYHVDAVTLQPYGEGWQDEMAMGRVIEGTFRSLNNLLEHLHQSFFFYLLMERERFVSIGTYLPSAMLVAANFTIMAISLWMRSGQPGSTGETSTQGTSEETKAPTVERQLFLPLGVVAVCQFLGILPLYLFNHLPESVRFHPSFDFEPTAPTLILTALPLLAAGRDVCCIRGFQRSPAAHLLPSPYHLLQAVGATIPADQIFLAAPLRNVLILLGHPELQPGIPRRPAGEPIELHSTLAAVNSDPPGLDRPLERDSAAYGAFDRLLRVEPRHQQRIT